MRKLGFTLFILITGCGGPANEQERNMDVIRRMLAAGDAGDLTVTEEVFSSDIVVHFGASDLARGDALELIRSALSAFPDMQHDVEDLFAVEDKVVLRGSITATHRSEFQGIAATGKTITIGQIAIYRFEEGKIVEYWEQVDLLGMMQQLGAIPEG